MAFQIRSMTKEDWSNVSRIYQQGMDTNLATFEAKCPDYEAFDASHISDFRYVITDSGAVIGWAALSPVSSRCVYGGVAEVSIYLDEAYKGKGTGTQLLTYLAEQSEQAGYWMLQSSIMQDNHASIRLHEKCGFRMVGYREKIGKDRYGQWRNTVLMEKRSHQPQFVEDNKGVNSCCDDEGGCCNTQPNNQFRSESSMKTMSIYEPAMCCETGICGVGVDPELLRISTVFNNLQKNGVTASRFNLNSAPQAFINNTTINKLINGSEGVDALPATLIDGEIVKTKAYPTNEEIAAWLQIPASYLGEEKTKGTTTPKENGGCGCDCKSGCC